MLTYAVKLTSRYDGMVVATFPDVPDAIGYGRDDEEAREEALRALERVLDGVQRAGELIPMPRAVASQSVTTTRFSARAEPAIVAAAIP